MKATVKTSNLHTAIDKHTRNTTSGYNSIQKTLAVVTENNGLSFFSQQEGLVTRTFLEADITNDDVVSFNIPQFILRETVIDLRPCSDSINIEYQEGHQFVHLITDDGINKNHVRVVTNSNEHPYKEALKFTQDSENKVSFTISKSTFLLLANAGSVGTKAGGVFGNLKLSFFDGSLDVTALDGFRGYKINIEPDEIIHDGEIEVFVGCGHMVDMGGIHSSTVIDDDGTEKEITLTISENYIVIEDGQDTSWVKVSELEKDKYPDLSGVNLGHFTSEVTLDTSKIKPIRNSDVVKVKPDNSKMELGLDWIIDGAFNSGEKSVISQYTECLEIKMDETILSDGLHLHPAYLEHAIKSLNILKDPVLPTLYIDEIGLRLLIDRNPVSILIMGVNEIKRQKDKEKQAKEKQDES